MGGTGDPPVPVGDSPTGTSKAGPRNRPPSFVGGALSIPSGESPDGTGQWPVLPRIESQTRSMRICTIGFTHKNAEDFFTRLQKSGVKRVVDVRLNNVSQLAGFSKRDDLKYFLNAILGIDYVHLPILAPTQDIFDEFKKKKGDWNVFEQKFVRLIKDRRIEKEVPREVIDEGCLLCSEDKPHYCHRRLVAEYLREKWGGLRIEHL